MKRLTEAWFEFAGVRCNEIGIRLQSMPKRPVPAKQGQKIEIDGQNGFLWQGIQGAYNPIRIDVECTTTDVFSADVLAGWLAESGLLRFSDEPDRAYDARVIGEFMRESMHFGFDQEKFIIPFECQPLKYVYPAALPLTMTEPGIVNNYGTAFSAPKITIEGTGNIQLIIGDKNIDVTGGGVIIDSDLEDCFEPDGLALANNRVTLEEFPRLQPGKTAISWTGDVNRVIVDGRWRFL